MAWNTLTRSQVMLEDMGRAVWFGRQGDKIQVVVMVGSWIEVRALFHGTDVQPCSLCR